MRNWPVLKLVSNFKMDILHQYIETISENFFDPKKRVFFGYLLSAFVISFLWLTIVKKEKVKQTINKIFDKKVFIVWVIQN